MWSKTEICNLSLAHIGHGETIANIDTEKSAAAYACKQFYEITRQLTLRGYPWPFARTQAALGLVEEDPTTEWAYSYQYPSDCILASRILPGLRTETQGDEVAFLINYTSSGKLIYTDASEAILEYTKNVEDENLFSSDFVMAMSFLLGAYITPRLTGGDPQNQRGKCLELYSMHMPIARNNAKFEERPDREVESLFITGRDSS